MITNDIQKIFDRFNSLIFGGELKPVPIVPSRARTFLAAVKFERKRNLFGKVTYSNVRMVVSGQILTLKTEQEVEDVIIHEMIHYYILSKEWKDDAPHGTVFRRMMDEINLKFARNISVSHKLGKEETAKKQEERRNRIRKHVFCVARFRDGQIGIIVVAEARIFDFWESVKSIRDMKEYAWYMSTDIFFNRYPHSKTLKFYVITQVEIDEHVNNAVRLERCGDEIRAVR